MAGILFLVSFVAPLLNNSKFRLSFFWTGKSAIQSVKLPTYVWIHKLRLCELGHSFEITILLLITPSHTIICMHSPSVVVAYQMLRHEATQPMHTHMALKHQSGALIYKTITSFIHYSIFHVLSNPINNVRWVVYMVISTKNSCFDGPPNCYFDVQVAMWCQLGFPCRSFRSGGHDGVYCHA